MFLPSGIPIPKSPPFPNQNSVPSPLSGEPAPADTPRVSAASEGPASRRGEGEGRAEGQRGGSEASVSERCRRHRGGESAPERWPSLKGVGWCR